LARVLAPAFALRTRQGISCFLGGTKGDRQNLGRMVRAPALLRLCPVDAYLDWIDAAQLTSGAVYRSIDRSGHVGENDLHIDSIAPLLRAMLRNGGLALAGTYRGHSQRRGFANWTASDGWDVQIFMLLSLRRFRHYQFADEILVLEHVGPATAQWNGCRGVHQLHASLLSEFIHERVFLRQHREVLEA
jgi:hypothetical protein